jgi:hypothetical protein
MSFEETQTELPIGVTKEGNIVFKQRRRLHIHLSQSRVDALARGYNVDVTQDGQPVTLHPDRYCCSELRRVIKKLGSSGSKVYAKILICPFCQTKLNQED